MNSQRYGSSHAGEQTLLWHGLHNHGVYEERSGQALPDTVVVPMNSSTREEDAMHRRKGVLLSGSLTLLLLSGIPCRAAVEDTQAVTKEAVLQWVDDNREAQPAFQAGDVLSLADLEKLRPFLPPGYLEEFRFPDVSFAITPPGDYSPPQLFRTATEQYAGQTRLAADGALENYVAGQPFISASLDPQDSTAGLKAMWNYNFRWQY